MNLERIRGRHEQVKAFLLGLVLVLSGCAVTGPTVSRQEEQAARGQIQQADYRVWWNYQKRIFRVSDRLAWGITTPGAPYRSAFGILPVFRKSASSSELALFHALGDPPDGTVLHVSAGSPGERAGISDNDIIVAIDEKSISTFSIAELVELAGSGQTRRFSFIKRGENVIRIVPVTPRPKLDITFVVDRSQKVNASAGPYLGTNLIKVNYGLINLFQSDDELSVFVGHEVVHILKNHAGSTKAIYAVGGLIELGIAIAGAVRGVDTTNIRRGVSSLTRIVDIRYTREQEREADYLGLYLAHQAGFNVDIAPIAWERFAVATPEGMDDHFLNNHPTNPERVVRIQKTLEEISLGRTLQQAWVGDSQGTQVASTEFRRPIPDSVQTAKTPTILPSALAVPSTTPAQPNIEIASLKAAQPQVTSQEKNKPTEKIYASLVQFDGPRTRYGVTLDAEFMDDGSGAGDAKVIHPANAYTLKGKFRSLKPGDMAELNILTMDAIKKLKLREDVPWISAIFMGSDTVLECVYGVTPPFNQKKGTCRDNHGNRYNLVF